MRIALVGHGALGTLYGHAFSRTAEHQVIFVNQQNQGSPVTQHPPQGQ